MDKKTQILKEIEYIFRHELGDSNLQISFTSSPDSIEKWDSINNLVLISAIEEKYNIIFSADSIFDIKNIGDIVDYIYENVSV